jgi:signal transduction histidine kinase
MITKVALILSLLLQFVAAILSIRLTRLTKYNLSWILISIGFILMAISRMIDIMPFFYEKIPFDTARLITWMGFVTSLFFVVGVILIRRIFIFLKKVEENRKEAEKRVLNAIIQTEEIERKRFAKDLHDGLGPILSTIKLSVSKLSEMDQEKSHTEVLRNTDYLINEAIKTIKEISDNLSPHMLKNIGLASAVKNFTNRIIGPKVPRIIFESRVICELINNSIKHANASNIEVLLNKQDDTILISYSDDGVGFDTNKVIHGEEKGRGYSNMISRIRSIKGTIDIESQPDFGMKAIVRVKV